MIYIITYTFYSAATTELVHHYEQQLVHFLNGATVKQFKHMFLACAPPSELLHDKLRIMIKLRSFWDNETLLDLTKLVCELGVSSNFFHLEKVEDGCIAVTWLCSTSKVKQLKIDIFEAADSIQSKGVLQVFVGEELVLEECSQTFSATGTYSYFVIFN